MKRTKHKVKICQKCCSENPVNVNECKKCGSGRFSPTFVRKLEKINKNFFVQITDPYEGEEQRVTLYKWWPGGRVSLHINTAEQWEKLRNIIENRLIQFLNWKTKEKLVSEIPHLEKSGIDASRQMKSLTKNYPDFIRKIIGAIDYSRISETNFPELVEIISDLVKILRKTDEGFRFAFRKLIEQLPQQPKRAIEDLSKLLKSWSLKQITSITYQVIDRLETLKLFKERILDNKTYEIIGDNSLHRILEKAMWIIDERYWLMHSNEELRKIVIQELPKRYKKFAKKRPDFVCGTVGNKIIVIELKRPSHTLNIEDLNQLETYLTIIEDYHSIKTYEAILVGKKKGQDLKKVLRYRSNFKVKTYTELISDTENRYRNYMDVLEKSNGEELDQIE